MQKLALRKLLENVRAGELPVEAALEALRDLPYAELEFAKVDHHRALRIGQPEVIFGLGKTVPQLVAIANELHAHGHAVFITRVVEADATALQAALPALVYDAASRTALWHSDASTTALAATATRGPICVVTAGTSDLPVAYEAIATARALGNQVTQLFDVGVAGLHRLLAQREQLYAASVIIVIAGMEGALASVVGGLVGVPVIAVPTSIGYGASFGGITALLSMLNSCASGVTVVNIDNGFGAAYAATLINQAGLP